MISVDYREKKNVLIITFENPYDIVKDTIASEQEIRKVLDNNKENLHYVADLRQLNISFPDLVQGLAQAFGNSESVYANPRLISYTVGDSELVKLGSKAVSEQAQYGKVPIKLFTTVDKALKEIYNN